MLMKKNLDFPSVDESNPHNLNIILISGKAGAGKDTAAGILNEHLRARENISVISGFADNLKSVLTSRLFDWDGKKDDNGRKLLTEIGTDIAHQIDPFLWSRRWLENVQMYFNYRLALAPKKVTSRLFAIAPDWRFPNEAQYLTLQNNVRVFKLRLIRDNFELENYDLFKKHASETALDDYDGFQATIKNNETTDDLERRLVDYLDFFIEEWVI